MSVIDHPNYSEEKDRLKYTIDYVEASIIATNKNRKKYKADMREAFLDLDPTDSSLSYVKIMTNAKFLDNLDKNYDGLIRSRKNPYFCRIDFQIEGNSEKSKLYIGKMSLAKAEDNSLIIIDWRSPIATVYYDGRLGSVSYKSPEGFTRGELFLKRQYSIKHRNLDSIMDVDITTNDTFLQKALGENKDNKLKDIVSTIQSEQNVIIRSEIDNPIIVQGAAGSGKTTIALHRIAYLIYTYEKTFYPDNFLIIAPNNLFLDYISGVLPDLGVDKVIQSTFEKLVFDLTGTKYKVINPDEKLIKIIENKTDIEEINVIKKISKYKGSLEYIKLIDTFITNVLKDFIPKEDFIVENYTIYTYSEMNSIFLEDFKYLPVYERLPELKKVISNRFKLQKKIILKEIERKYDSQIDTIRMNLKNSEDKRNKLVYLMDERDNKLASFKKSSRTAIRKFFDKFKKREIDSYYVDFIKSIKNANIDNNEYKDIINDLVKKSIDNISKNQLEYEDLTPILYLKYKVFSLDKNLDIKYIVVDEAQDFSPLQIYILKKIFRTELFTLLGDISQGIHSYRGINSWSEIFDQVFQSKFKKFLTLEQSYRTTVEIMNTA
ncbi:MAG: UvrD-helicase domain-containing protein, partial [Clostridiales bacterium]